MVNNPDLLLRAAVDGLGIAYTIEAYAEPFLRSGQLVRVLEDWSPTIEGLFLYYPGRRQVPAALRALIDMIRTSSSRPAKSSLQNPFAEHWYRGTEVLISWRGQRRTGRFSGSTSNSMLRATRG